MRNQKKKKKTKKENTYLPKKSCNLAFPGPYKSEYKIEGHAVLKCLEGLLCLQKSKKITSLLKIYLALREFNILH